MSPSESYPSTPLAHSTTGPNIAGIRRSRSRKSKNQIIWALGVKPRALTDNNKPSSEILSRHHFMLTDSSIDTINKKKISSEEDCQRIYWTKSSSFSHVSKSSSSGDDLDQNKTHALPLISPRVPAITLFAHTNNDEGWNKRTTKNNSSTTINTIGHGQLSNSIQLDRNLAAATAAKAAAANNITTITTQTCRQITPPRQSCNSIRYSESMMTLWGDWTSRLTWNSTGPIIRSHDASADDNNNNTSWLFGDTQWLAGGAGRRVARWPRAAPTTTPGTTRIL